MSAKKKKAKQGKGTPAKKRRLVAAKPAAKKLAAKKLGAKKPAATKSAAKKTGAKKQAVRPTARKAPRAAKGKRAAASPARAKPIQRRDATGHLNAKYASELRALSSRDAEPSSFVAKPRSTDDLVEELGEEFVSQATSAEHEGEDVLNQEVPEERGGPFVETSGDQEFAVGTDPSNPKDATREPFPRT